MGTTHKRQIPTCGRQAPGVRDASLTTLLPGLDESWPDLVTRHSSLPLTNRKRKMSRLSLASWLRPALVP